MSDLQFKTYERKPFRVEAIKITEDNIDEIGDLIGEVKIHTRTGAKFIATNPKIVSEVGYVYIGWYLTRYKNKYRCYKPVVFEKEFRKHRGYRSINNQIKNSQASVYSSNEEELDRPFGFTIPG